VVPWLGGPLSAVLELATLALAALVVMAAAQAPPRLRPPDAVQCARDHLTAYVGTVIRYQRERDRTSIRIRTDWDTIEDVSIRHPGSDAARWFLFDGKPFPAADMALIEGRTGQLRAGMRAAAWVCDGGDNPIVDWNPPREG